MIEAPSVIDKLKNKYVMLVAAIAALAYIAIAAAGKEDFFIYLSAAKDLFAQKDIYSLTYKNGYHYYYSVLFAAAIYPLSLLPLYVANFIWLALNVFLLTRMVKIAGRYFNLDTLSVKAQWVFIALCFVSCIKFVLQNIDCQQATILIMYLTLEGLEQVFAGKKSRGAALIALAINIKLLPLLFIPYLIYRKEFKAFLYILLYYGLFLMLPLAFIGRQQNMFYLHSWLHLINPDAPKQILDTDEGGFASLATLLSTLLVKQAPLPDDPHNITRNITDIGIDTFKILITAVRLAFVALSLYFLRTMPFKEKVGKQHRYWEMAYLFLITPLIFPHQQYYSYLLAAPALCYIYYHFLTHYSTASKMRNNVLIALFVLSFLLCNGGYIIGAYNWAFRFFKITVYGLLLIVPLLAVSVPEKEEVI